MKVVNVYEGKEEPMHFTCSDKIRFNFAGKNTYPPGLVEQLHKHDDEDCFYYIVEGGCLVTVGEEKRELRKGDLVFIPHKVHHGFTVSKEGLRLLDIHIKVT